jgi:hypothetical protein
VGILNSSLIDGEGKNSFNNLEFSLPRYQIKTITFDAGDVIRIGGPSYFSGLKRWPFWLNVLSLFANFPRNCKLLKSYMFKEKADQRLNAIYMGGVEN